MTTSLTLLAALVLGAPALKEKEPLGKGPGYLGIRFTKDGDGLLITEVQPDSPALKAGVRAEDIIMKIDMVDFKDADTNEFVKLIGGMRPGTVINVQIVRGKETMVMKIKLAPRPANFEATPTIPLPPLPPND